MSVGFGINHRLDAGSDELLADCIGILAAVGEERFDPIAEHSEQRRNAPYIVRLAGRQHETKRQATCLPTCVELCGGHSPRLAERLFAESSFQADCTMRRSDHRAFDCVGGGARTRQFGPLFLHGTEHTCRPHLNCVKDSVTLAVLIREMPLLRGSAHDPHHSFRWAKAASRGQSRIEELGSG